MVLETQLTVNVHKLSMATSDYNRRKWTAATENSIQKETDSTRSDNLMNSTIAEYSKDGTTCSFRLSISNMVTN